MRRRLVAYFDRRNRPSADDLADETLNRIARTLEQGAVIATRPPARYCYIVAKFVLLEDFRRERRDVSFDESWRAQTTPAAHADAHDSRIIREHRLERLARGRDALKDDQRTLIVEYSAAARRERIDRRRGLAERLGISMNALSIRVWRLRDGLKACLEACRGRAPMGRGPRG